MSYRLIGPVATLCVAVLSAGPVLAQVAPQEPDYFRTDSSGGERVVFRIDRERTANDWYVIGGLGGGALLFGVVGVLFHRDASNAANDVSADEFTGRTWTPALQSRHDRSVRSGGIATVSYAVGGGLALATVIAFFLTDPGTEIVTKQDDAPKPYVVPTPGGMMVGQEWSF